MGRREQQRRSVVEWGVQARRDAERDSEGYFFSPSLSLSSNDFSFPSLFFWDCGVHDRELGMEAGPGGGKRRRGKMGGTRYELEKRVEKGDAIVWEEKEEKNFWAARIRSLE